MSVLLTRNELDLDDFVDVIIHRQPVIPIIGPKAFQVEEEGRSWYLDDLIRHKLPDLLKLDGDLLPEHYTVNNVVDSFLRLGGSIDQVRTRLYRYLSKTEWQPDETLQRLAAFRFFKIYVTVTADSLLLDALQTTRSSKERQPSSHEYLNDNSREEDIPGYQARNRAPVVYQLFGQAKPGSFAITDGDYVEYLSSLGERSYQPSLLFRQLRESHLLFLGVGFESWLARFFMRVIRTQRFSVPRNRNDLFLEDEIRGDDNQILFLQNHSVDARIEDELSPAEFVRQLHARIEEAAPHLLASAGVPSPEDSSGPDEEEDEDEDALSPGKVEVLSEMRQGSIFLSYASEDREAVRRLRQRLEEENLDVWMDEQKINSGSWRRAIKRNIKSSWLFVPVLSQRMTVDRSPRVFREEWQIALDHATRFTGAGITFIHPVRIDDFDLDADGVSIFAEQEMHIISAPDGELSEKQVRVIRDLYRERQLAER